MDRITIETGMMDISSATCVKFVPRTHEANFLDIQSRTGSVLCIHTQPYSISVLFHISYFTGQHKTSDLHLEKVTVYVIF